MFLTDAARAVIVDDSAALRGQVQGLVSEKVGIAVIGTAASLAEAVKLIDEQRPDLVFLDVFLGKDAGLDVLRHVRESAQSVQVAIITGSPSDELKRYCLALGANWFIDKAQLAGEIEQVCCELLSDHAVSRQR